MTDRMIYEETVSVATCMNQLSSRTNRAVWCGDNEFVFVLGETPDSKFWRDTGCSVGRFPTFFLAASGKSTDIPL
jgi:hypothetical protein